MKTRVSPSSIRVTPARAPGRVFVLSRTGPLPIYRTAIPPTPGVAPELQEQPQERLVHARPVLEAGQDVENPGAALAGIAVVENWLREFEGRS